MADQIPKSFDSESIKKIVKGAFYAVTPAAAIALLNYVGTIQIDNATLAAVVAWAVPFLINAVKEWFKGK